MLRGLLQTRVKFLAAMALIQGTMAQEHVSGLPICPTCYTHTIIIPPPCAPPITCTGPSTPPAWGCTRTIDMRPTTYTVPGFNPACPTTPTATSNGGCPSWPACSQSLCSTVTLGRPGGDIWTTITEPAMKCIPTTTYTIPSKTTPSLSYDTTITPPPFPSFAPDED
ncbi:hypothetical protein QBC47DRAFT_418955 [Echria macrotheca]|uniref:Uncharacterized protein n=1 Tax=Echria macrotheca TaxID=438768 RepID=A0AAJ0B0H2_9PEZI|nr:hypothetical protein QBC47DRAFT_418955 [Echria macrotheca]